MLKVNTFDHVIKNMPFLCEALKHVIISQFFIPCALFENILITSINFDQSSMSDAILTAQFTNDLLTTRT